MKLTHKISTSGSLYCTFSFESEEDALMWIEQTYPKLKAQYPGLSPVTKASITKLDGLNIGDTCFVYGEGSDTFKITDIVNWGAHRFGFLLDNGCSEEVSKCYKYPGCIEAGTVSSEIYDSLLQSIDELESNSPPADVTSGPPKKLIGYLFGYKQTVALAAEAGGQSFKVQFFTGISPSAPSAKYRKHKDYWEQKIFEGDFSALILDLSNYRDMALRILVAAKSDLAYNTLADQSFEIAQLMTAWGRSYSPVGDKETQFYQYLLYSMTQIESMYLMERKQLAPECLKQFLSQYLKTAEADLDTRYAEYCMFNDELREIQTREYEADLAMCLSS